jgi:hypothetical protein
LWLSLRDLAGFDASGPFEIVDQACGRFANMSRIRAYQLPPFFAEILDNLSLIYRLVFRITVIDYFVLPLLCLVGVLLGKRRWRKG